MLVFGQPVASAKVLSKEERAEAIGEICGKVWAYQFADDVSAKQVKRELWRAVNKLSRLNIITTPAKLLEVVSRVNLESTWAADLEG